MENENAIEMWIFHIVETKVFGKFSLFFNKNVNLEKKKKRLKMKKNLPNSWNQKIEQKEKESHC
jgi:hypothetical protein